MVSMFASKKRLWRVFYTILLAGFLVYLLCWRWQVSTTRFFDVDEFSYMHWTAQVARGEHMYTDFFSYFTPGFMWAFAPIFWIYGVSVQVFTAARAVSFVIFLGILGSLGYLFGITRGWKWAILPVILLAFLPMPYDKFLEIRPDNLAILLAILGVIGETLAIRGKKKIFWLLTGLTYSASLFVLAKTAPIVAVGVAIAVISARKNLKKLLIFFLGLVVPWILFFFVSWASGNFDVVWYSLTRLPFEAYKTAAYYYYMGVNLFFYPNAWFYGGNGYTITLGLVVNHIIWIIGLLFGAYRLVTPIRKGREHEALVELLLAGIFFVSVAAFAKFFPFKHTQYLIPIAVFVAYYAGDGLAIVFEWIERAGGFASLVIVLIGLVYVLTTVTKDINKDKTLYANAYELKELAIMIRTIPHTARVVDLEGRMVFWQEGYPVSSLPIDDVLSSVSRRPPPLMQYLASNPADYIYDGESNRIKGLSSENLTYIRAHFAPVPGYSLRLWKRIQ